MSDKIDRRLVGAPFHLYSFIRLLGFRRCKGKGRSGIVLRTYRNCVKTVAYRKLVLTNGLRHQAWRCRRFPSLSSVHPLGHCNEGCSWLSRVLRTRLWNNCFWDSWYFAPSACPSIESIAPQISGIVRHAQSAT